MIPLVIVDRISTLESEPKDRAYMANWWSVHTDRYAVLVAQAPAHEAIVWVSLNPCSSRCAYAGVADLSAYVRRAWRGREWEALC